MRKVGDPHNFGKYVSEIEINGLRGFQKPRSVFWEYLFFSRQSPLVPIFAESAAGSFDFIFGLDVIERSDQQGVVRAVENVDGAPSPDFMFKFGALLAYAVAFGIQDLHKQNVILAAHGPQPIDVEIVFSRLSLPDETQLLKRRSAETDHVSFLSSVHPCSNDLVAHELKELLSGLLRMLSFLTKHSAEIAEVIDHAIGAEAAPVRFRTLLRSTKIYREHLDSGSDVQFLPQEQVQLERRDVPYFFKYMNDARIYCMTSATTFEPVEPRSAIFSEATVASVKPRDFLTERFNGLLPQTVLYLLKHHASRDWRGHLNVDDFLFESHDSHFVFRSGLRSYQAKR